MPDFAKDFSVAAFLVLFLLGICGCGCSDKKQGQEKTTKANYDKVTVGMSESEVVDLLGSPSSSTDETDENGSVTKMGWFGTEGMGGIMIELRDGKVAKKMGSVRRKE